MSKKSTKDAERDQSLERFYQGHNEFNEFVGINNYNTDNYGAHTVRRKMIERRINEQRYGMFGNALITLGVIIVFIVVFFFLL